MPSYRTKDDVLQVAQLTLGKTLRDFIPATHIQRIESELRKYKNSRKGYFGELTEEFVFGLPRNIRSEADFKLAGVELKTTPIKESKRKTYNLGTYTKSMMGYPRRRHKYVMA